MVSYLKITRKEVIKPVKAFRILARSVRDSFKSVFRNFSLSIASILCTTITLILVAIAIVVTVNVNHITKDLEEELTIVVYADAETSDERLNEIEEEIKNIKNINICTNLKEMIEKDIFATNVYTLGYYSDSYANLDYTNKIEIM